MEVDHKSVYELCMNVRLKSKTLLTVQTYEVISGKSNMFTVFTYVRGSSQISSDDNTKKCRDIQIWKLCTYMKLFLGTHCYTFLDLAMTGRQEDNFKCI